MRDQLNLLTVAITLGSTILGGFLVFILTYSFNNIGRTKVLVSNMERRLYKKNPADDSEVEVEEKPYADYDNFKCSFTIGIYNSSQQRKVIHNISYGMRDWLITREPTRIPIRKQALNLQPKECYAIEFTIEYPRQYRDYFRRKKHYICFDNAHGKLRKKRIRKVEERSKIEEDIRWLNKYEKPFHIVYNSEDNSAFRVNK